MLFAFNTVMAATESQPDAIIETQNAEGDDFSPSSNSLHGGLDMMVQNNSFEDL